MICFASHNSHSHSFIPPLPLEIQDALDRSIQVQTSMVHSDLDSDKTARAKTVQKLCIQIRSFHSFNFSTLSFLLALEGKKSSLESSLTAWSNLLDVSIRIYIVYMTQHNCARGSSELGFGQICFQLWAASHKADPMAPTNPFEANLATALRTCTRQELAAGDANL